jgi:2-polyprenyl-6-methoxyphenol hydroxylase-like FAD-dependent oxidoreductase
LECKGFDYIVYERDESEHFNPGGGSLDIHEEDGQRALREAGLFGDFQKHARWEDDVFQVYDMLGKKWAQLGGETTPGQNSGGRPEIDRLALRKILLNSIPKHKICWNSSLKRVTSGEDGAPVLEFTDGRIATGFSLIVGADGAWSKVRPLVSLTMNRVIRKNRLLTVYRLLKLNPSIRISFI